MQEKYETKIPDPVYVPAPEEQQNGSCLDIKLYLNPGLARIPVLLFVFTKSTSIHPHVSLISKCSGHTR